VESRLTDRFVVVGRVLAPHGLKGDLRAEIHSDTPGRFTDGSMVFIDGEQFVIERSFGYKHTTILLHFVGIETKSQADNFRGKMLEILEEEVSPLPDGHYYHYQMLGMSVYTDEGTFLGSIDEILSTRANDVYVLKTNGKQILIPALKKFVKHVDVRSREMRVCLINGMAE